MVGISCQFDRSSGHLEGGPLGLWGIILIVLRWRYQDQPIVCGIIPGPGSWTVKNRESELSTSVHHFLLSSYGCSVTSYLGYLY